MAERFEFLDVFGGERGEAFALGLIALHADKLLDVDFLRVAETVGFAEGETKTGIDLVSEENEARCGIVTDERCGTGLRNAFEGEALDVGEPILVSIIEYSGPDFLLVELLHTEDARGFIVVVDVEGGGVERAVVEYHKHEVVGMEFSEIGSALVVVETLHIVVEPYLSAAQRGSSVGLEGDAVDIEAGEEVASALTSLDENLAEVLVEADALEFGIGLEGDLDDFGLSVGVGSEVENARPGGAHRHVILAVVGDGGDVETLDVAGVGGSVHVDHIIYGAFVTLFEHGDVDDFRLFLAFLSLHALSLADEHLVLHAGHLVGSVAIEDDDIVDGGAVFHEFVLLQSGSHEAVLTVDIELFVGFDHLGGLNVVEGADFGASRMLRCIFVADEAIPVGGDFHHVLEIVVDTGHFFLHARDEFFGPFLVELEDASHLDFHEAQDVVACHGAIEGRLEGFEA